MAPARDRQRQPRPHSEPAAPREGPTRAQALALQGAVGNRGLGAVLARRPVTVELRTPPPWPKPPPAVDRTTPENRTLAEEIDALDKLSDAELIKKRTEVTLATPHVGVMNSEKAEHARSLMTLNAIEYVASQRVKQARWEGASARARDLGPVTPNWSNYGEVRRDPRRRQAWVRWLVEQRVREEGSFKDAMKVIRSTETYGADLSEIEADLHSLEQEAEQFGKDFTLQAKKNGFRVLNGSMDVIDKTLTDYGVPLAAAHGAADEINLEDQGVPAHHIDAEKAADLLITKMKEDPKTSNADAQWKNRRALGDEAKHLVELQQRVEATRKTMWDNAAHGKDDTAVADKTAYVNAKDDLVAAWLAAERAHPVLASYRRGATREKASTADSPFAGIDITALAGASVDAEMKGVLLHILPTLAHIRRAKERLAAGMSPMRLPAVVALTEANMFIPEGSIRSGVVADLVAAQTRESWLVMAAGIALSLVTLIPTGGASLAIVNLAAGTLAAYTALQELEKYETQKVLVDTDLDKARSLSQEDPSLTGFAMSLVSLGLEPLIALHALRKAAELRVLVRRGLSTTSAVDELDKLGGSKVPNLGKRALDEVEQIENAAVQARRVAVKPPIPDPWHGRGVTLQAAEKQIHYATAADMRTGLVKALRDETVHGAAPKGSLMEEVRKAIKAGQVPADANKDLLELLEQAYALNRDPNAIGDAAAGVWNAANGRTTREAVEGLVGPYVDVENLTKSVLQGRPTFRDMGFASDFHGAHTHMFSEYLLDLKLGPGAGRRLRQAIGNAKGPVIEWGGRRREFWEAVWDAVYDVGEGSEINRPEVLGKILQKHLGFPRFKP